MDYICERNLIWFKLVLSGTLLCKSKNNDYPCSCSFKISKQGFSHAIHRTIAAILDMITLSVEK
jgi:hypothetical protein